MSSDRSAIRAQIHVLSVAGYTPTEIANMLGVDRNTVYLWKDGPRGQGYRDLERKGRPRKLTGHQEAALVVHAKANRRSTFRSLSKWCVERGYPISHETVRRILLKHGICSTALGDTPKLTDDHKRRQLEFCERFKNFDWRTAMFVGETKFTIYPKRNPKMDRYLTWSGASPLSRPILGYGPEFSAWAGISVHGVTDLQIYEGNLNASYYRDILKIGCADVKRDLFHGNSWTLFQDGATVHTAQSTQQWLREQKFSFVPKDRWPANSPDLNPMKNLWALVKQRLKAYKLATLSQLKSAVAEEWEKISSQHCENLLLSLPKRMQQVVERKGGRADY